MYKSQFMAYLGHQKRYASHTITAYQKDLEQFEAFLELSAITDASTADYQQVRNYIAALMDDQVAATSIGRKLSVLRSYFKFLLREGYVQKDPMQLIKAPKQPKRLPVFVEAHQMDSLLDDPAGFDESFPQQRDKLVLEILFGTGIRLSELTGLKETDVSVYDQSVKVLGKRSKERIIPVPKQLMDQIAAYIALKTLQKFDNNSGFLIVTDKGEAAYSKLIYRIVNNYLKKISTKDKRSPHVLRHSYATSLLNNGADLNAIKELLGHASLAATQVYVHNSVERLKTIYKQAHPKA